MHLISSPTETKEGSCTNLTHHSFHAHFLQIRIRWKPAGKNDRDPRGEGRQESCVADDSNCCAWWGTTAAILRSLWDSTRIWFLACCLPAFLHVQYTTKALPLIFAKAWNSSDPFCFFWTHVSGLCNFVLKTIHACMTR